MAALGGNPSRLPNRPNGRRGGWGCLLYMHGGSLICKKLATDQLRTVLI